MTVVDDRHDRLDPLEVLGVLGDIGPGRHQLGDERDPLAELGVLVEEHVEGGETAQDVLRQVGAVDPEDQIGRDDAAATLAQSRATRGRAATAWIASASIGSG